MTRDFHQNQRQLCIAKRLLRLRVTYNHHHERQWSSPSDPRPSAKTRDPQIFDFRNCQNNEASYFLEVYGSRDNFTLPSTKNDLS